MIPSVKITNLLKSQSFLRPPFLYWFIFSVKIIIFLALIVGFYFLAISPILSLFYGFKAINYSLIAVLIIVLYPVMVFLNSFFYLLELSLIVQNFEGAPSLLKGFKGSLKLLIPYIIYTKILRIPKEVKVLAQAFGDPEHTGKYLYRLDYIQNLVLDYELFKILLTGEGSLFKAIFFENFKNLSSNKEYLVRYFELMLNFLNPITLFYCFAAGFSLFVVTAILGLPSFYIISAFLLAVFGTPIFYTILKQKKIILVEPVFFYGLFAGDFSILNLISQGAGKIVARKPKFILSILIAVFSLAILIVGSNFYQTNRKVLLAIGLCGLLLAFFNLVLNLLKIKLLQPRAFFSGGGGISNSEYIEVAPEAKSYQENLGRSYSDIMSGEKPLALWWLKITKIILYLCYIPFLGVIFGPLDMILISGFFLSNISYFKRSSQFFRKGIVAATFSFLTFLPFLNFIFAYLAIKKINEVLLIINTKKDKEY